MTDTKGDAGASRPLIGITADVEARGPSEAACCRLTYARAVAAAGGVPVFLAPIPELAAEHARACAAIVLTGGDDPRMEEFGAATHPRATPLHPLRQAYELALLRALDGRPGAPVLGVCLGMQLMALHAGGTLDQHLPDSRPDAGRHWDAMHAIVPREGLLTHGDVHSRHRQAVVSPGRLVIAAESDDGLVEAVVDPTRPFYLGVQWHPERTDDPALGLDLFKRLVAAAAGGARGTAAVVGPGRAAADRG